MAFRGLIMARKYKPLKTIEFIIGEDTWKCHLWKLKTYVKLYGDDSDGITDIATREMSFYKEELNLETAIHEVVHAYATLLHLESTVEMSKDDYEEVWASFLAKNIHRIIEKSNIIIKEFTTTKPSDII